MNRTLTKESKVAFAIGAAPPVLAAIFGVATKVFTGMDPVAVGGTVFVVGAPLAMNVLDDYYKNRAQGSECAGFLAGTGVLIAAAVLSP